MPVITVEGDFSGLGTMHSCPECKREFLVSDGSQWVYKRGSKKLCSYSCTRKYDEKNRGKRTHNYPMSRR